MFGFLRDAGIDTVVVSGLAFDFCVGTTARQLLEAGFNVALYTPGSRGIFEAKCKETRDELNNIGVTILDSRKELEKYLN